MGLLLSTMEEEGHLLSSLSSCNHFSHLFENLFLFFNGGCYAEYYYDIFHEYLFRLAYETVHKTTHIELKLEGEDLSIL